MNGKTGPFSVRNNGGSLERGSAAAIWANALIIKSL
ncbi:hypothetical protein ILFOPFJJ_06983 [Ensifer psoraleae]|nr:hypothetical protein [Sinorhizobium psoraleae]